MLHGISLLYIQSAVHTKASHTAVTLVQWPPDQPDLLHQKTTSTEHLRGF